MPKTDSKNTELNCKGFMDVGDLLEEFLKDPEFKKEWEEHSIKEYGFIYTPETYRNSKEVFPTMK